MARLRAASARLTPKGNSSRSANVPELNAWASEILQEESDGSVRKFRGDEPVSMNFWGLTPAVFPLIEGRLVAFLSTNSSDPKAECYIPVAIGEMIALGQATLNVLPTDAEWFGVTYREDKPQVMQALKLAPRGRWCTQHLCGNSSFVGPRATLFLMVRSEVAGVDKLPKGSARGADLSGRRGRAYGEAWPHHSLG